MVEKVFRENPRAKRPLGRARIRWKDGIKKRAVRYHLKRLIGILELNKGPRNFGLEGASGRNRRVKQDLLF